MSKGVFWTTLVVAALFLVQYWLKFLIAIEAGDAVVHKNYWGQSVGTYLLLAVLLVATPVYFYLAWKYYSRKNKKNEF